MRPGLADALCSACPEQSTDLPRYGTTLPAHRPSATARLIPLPAIEFKGSSLRLGTMRFELRNIALQLGSKPSLGVTVAIGLPSELNKLFGTKADGTASVNVFRTYQPGLPDSLIGLSLKLDSNGLLAQVLSPPTHLHHWTSTELECPRHHSSAHHPFARVPALVPVLRDPLAFVRPGQRRRRQRQLEYCDAERCTTALLAARLSVHHRHHRQASAGVMSRSERL